MSQQDTGFTTPPWLLLSFEQRTRYEHLTNAFRSNTSGTEKHFPLRSRLRLEVGEPYRPVRFLLEIQDSRVLHNSEQLYSTGSNINEFDFLQAHFQLTSDLFPSKDSKSRILIGRFTMDLGKRRLVARNNMRNTTNAFDGISWTLAGRWDWTLRSFFTRPVSIDPYSLDTPGQRYFWGAYFNSTHYAGFLIDMYYLGLYDASTSGSKPELNTIGGRIYKLPKTGSFDYEIEAAEQFGRNNPLDHTAYFYHGELGFSPSTLWSPRISLSYDYASGDRDPEDDQSGRFNTLYGARGFEYTLTGIFGPVYRSNIDTPGIGITLNPSQDIQITARHRAFRLAQAKDVWVGSGIQDPTGNSGNSIGQNFEMRLRWETASLFTIKLGYARFFKGSYLHLAPESTVSGDSDYFFISTELKRKLLPY